MLLRSAHHELTAQIEIQLSELTTDTPSKRTSTKNKRASVSKRTKSTKPVEDKENVKEPGEPVQVRTEHQRTPFSEIPLDQLPEYQNVSDDKVAFSPLSKRSEPKFYARSSSKNLFGTRIQTFCLQASSPSTPKCIPQHTVQTFKRTAVNLHMKLKDQKEVLPPTPNSADEMPARNLRPRPLKTRLVSTQKKRACK